MSKKVKDLVTGDKIYAVIDTSENSSLPTYRIVELIVEVNDVVRELFVDSHATDKSRENEVTKFKQIIFNYDGKRYERTENVESEEDYLFCKIKKKGGSPFTCYLTKEDAINGRIDRINTLMTSILQVKNDCEYRLNHLESELKK